jgi:hypothetical protein
VTQTPFALGRVKRHDPRSLNYPAKVAGTVRSVRHTHYGPVLDQGNVGSCTGNAMAQWLNTKPGHKPRTPYLTEDDAVRLYSRASQLDPWDGWYDPTKGVEDTGSSGIAVCQAAKEEDRITGYGWAFGLDHALESLTLSPVLFGTVWTSDMFYPDSKGFVTATGDNSGGHEYLGLGLNLRGKYIWCLNNWNDSWGLGGFFKMSFTTLGELLKQDGDVVVPVL